MNFSSTLKALITLSIPTTLMLGVLYLSLN